MSEKRAFNLACSVAWAILPDSLRLILEISTREHLPDFEAVEAKRARYLDNTDTAKQRDGVAIIPVTGPIFRYANFFTEFSGGATVTTLARDFNVALNDPNISAILLNIDSPGGEVNGISEFAQMIFDSRGKKPIVAYVGGLGASAAYWIASAADEIVAADTAMLGSIGVVAAVPNPDAKSARDIEFVSSQSPNKRPNPNTESGRSHIQARIDDLAAVFIEAIARNRDVSAEAVIGEFGAGGVMVGEKAVAAGLADRLGSFEQTLSELAAARWQRKRKPQMKASADQTEDNAMSIEEIKAAVKETVASMLPGKPAAKEGITFPDGTTQATAYNAAEIAAKEKELAEAKAALAEARKTQAKADALLFVADQRTAKKLLPAEADAVAARFIQAAMDDYALPVAQGEKSRVEQLKAEFAARPAHKLFEETVVGEEHRTKPATDDKGGPISAERQKELLGMTSLGQAALHLVK